MEGKNLNFINPKICPLCAGNERIPYRPFKIKDIICHYWLCKCGMIYLAAYPEDQRGAYIASRAAQGPPEVITETRSYRRSRDRASKLPDHWKINSHLDVGCGTETFMEFVEEKYGCVSEGVDFAPVFLPSRKIYGSIDEIEKTYDLVSAMHVLEHVPDPLSFLNEIARVAHGYIMIEVPCTGQTGEGGVMHISIFSPWTLARMIQKTQIKILSLKQEQLVIEGQSSQSVISFVGRR